MPDPTGKRCVCSQARVIVGAGGHHRREEGVRLVQQAEVGPVGAQQPQRLVDHSLQDDVLIGDRRDAGSDLAQRALGRNAVRQGLA